MGDAQTEVVLVTPVWNDSERLSRFGPRLAEALVEADLPVRWVVSDDGSTEAERARLSRLIESFSSVYPKVEGHYLEERSRKGGAVYSAWDRFPEARWLAFVDADGAFEADSVVDLIRKAMDLGPDHACIAIRQNSAETPVYRRPGRGLSFTAFRLMVRILLGVNFSDTQCGAKVIPGAHYFAITDQLKERGFVFDVELLLLLERRGVRIHELAVPWREIPGGKVHPLSDAWSMLRGLFRIRARMR